MAGGRKRGNAQEENSEQVIRNVPVDDLVPYARNARKHPPEQIKAMKDFILRVGFVGSIIGDREGIMAGHGRVLAVKEIYADGGRVRLPNGNLIPEGTIPHLDVTGLSEDARRAYIVADNKLAQMAGWDEDILRIEMGHLRDTEFNMDILGFSESELRNVLTPKNSENPDENIDVRDGPPVAALGDVWVLGGHRVICGDSTDAEAVKRLLNGDVPKLMATDPPYGVNYDPSWRTSSALKALGRVRSSGKVENDDRADWTPAWQLFPGDAVYVWHGGLHSSEVQLSLEAAGFIMRAQIIWVKQHFVIGRGDYHWQHEPCWYAVRKGKKGHYAGDRKQSTTWDIANAGAMGGDRLTDDELTGHGTQKPVECMRKPIQNNSVKGDYVYDPFLGSATTLIAAEMEGRFCLGVELNPVYIDAGIRRWQKYSGQEAVLQGTGKTFAQVAAQRNKPKANRRAKK